MRTTRLTFTLIGAASLALAATAPATAKGGPPEDRPGRGATVYKVDFEEVNESSASGSGTLVAKDQGVRVNLDVQGLDDGVHLAHIHGFLAPGNECPTDANDLNDDGFVDLFEGAATYGPILVDLMPSDGTSFDFSRVFTTTDDPLGINPSGVPLDEVGSLSQFHIVVHGVYTDDQGNPVPETVDLYDPADFPAAFAPVIELTEKAFATSMPALCGEIIANGR